MKKPVKRRFYYPEIKPYDHGMLDVGDGHRLYWEASGNPKGKPALFLHGGPGGSAGPNNRRLFDPKKYRIILFDQRGCGRSKPFASIHANTTQHLVGDIEKLRKHLGIEKWLVLGGSWGSALALAYAETHPKRVTELILRGVFTVREKELSWFYQEGASFLFPDYWQDFIGILSPAERKNIRASYRRRLTSKNKRIQLEAARAWSGWEMRTLSLLPRPYVKRTHAEDQRDLSLALIENHYFVNHGFMKKDQLLRHAGKIKHIPGIIVQGRYDVVCPALTAWELHQKWPKSQLNIVADAGHAGAEPGIVDGLVRATDFFAKKRASK